MKDRFKFRFWNGNNFNYLDLSDNGYAEIIKEDKYIIQQSTGLSDEHGVLIYEGDVVKAKYGTYLIDFEIGGFMLVDKTSSCSLYGFEGCWNDNVYPISQLYFSYENKDGCIDELEIIGNIYEHKDLLNA